MGVCGYDGVYRNNMAPSSCEITMTVLKHNIDAVLNIMSSFVYDPLLEASRTRNNGYSGQEQLKMTEKKINGHIPVYEKGKTKFRVISDNSPKLSVQGQVDRLISQATGIKELSRMFPGWMPF